MNWKAVLCALCVSVSVAGCGGGGGGGGDQPIPQPGNELSTDAVRGRLHSFAQALISDNLNSIMSFYSESFLSVDGATKSDVRASLVESQKTVDVIGILFLDENYGVGEGGSVVSTFQWSLTGKAKDSDETASVRFTGAYGWRNENGTWRIVTGTVGDIVQVAMKKFNPRPL
jgi:ketosteroid isomerase-like protein